MKKQNCKVELESAFIDDRGIIQNILFKTIKSVAIITSKKGSVRSNHWHKSNWHYLYVVSGSMLYMERDLDGSNQKTFMCYAGDMVFTAAKKVHQTVFSEDTILLSLGRDPKNHKNHEEDLVRCKF